ncbi:MAG: VOC family protein [Chryseolinea sp.]
MIKLNKVHHVAIISSNYAVSKNFYVNILGFKIVAENYRDARDSYKLDLALGDEYCVELFSFPNPPARTSRPEACGLRHLAFEVDQLEDAVKWLNDHNIPTETIRVDEFTGKRFTFFADPDELPLEFYER